MAAIVCDAGLDLEKLRRHIDKELPEYARPLFIRLSHEIEVTGTFKHRKVELVKEGIDLALVKEPIYFNSPAEKKFVPLDLTLHDKICSGAFKL